MVVQNQHEMLGGFTPSLFQSIETVSHSGTQGSLGSSYAINSGTALYHVGDPCVSVYKILTGFFKITSETPNGNEKVLGFKIPDDIIGIDGIDEIQHSRNAIALQDSTVLRIRCFNFETFDKNTTDYRHEIYAILCKEIINQQGTMSVMENMSGRAKVADFILLLSNRLKKISLSQSEFTLFMSNIEIASYLGLAHETFSRTFMQLEQEKVIAIEHRKITILDRQRLQAIATNKL